jgi:hypothetical protein
VALRLGQNLLERNVIRRLLTQGQAAHAPIQHVLGEGTGGQARTTGHALLERMPAAVSRNDSRPLFFVPPQDVVVEDEFADLLLQLLILC